MPEPDGSELLTLQESADRLKVHYMTAYRWVRRGELPAFKAGGRLRVRRADLERFVTDREVDVALPPAEPGRTDWDTHAERLYAALLAGQGVEASGLVRKVVADGAPAGDVYIRLITPALHRVGRDWAEGRIGVAMEHRATEIAGALMARLGEFFRRRGPTKGAAVTMTPPGEAHGLASAMVADFLRAGGYEVHHLGANVPVEDLRLFLEVVPADVVCVSVTTPQATVAAGTPRVLAEIVRASREAGDVAVVIGGQAAAQATVEEAGAVYVDDLGKLVARLDALVHA